MAVSFQFSLCLLLAMGASIVVLGDVPAAPDTACNRINIFSVTASRIEFCKICVSTMVNTTTPTKGTCFFVHQSDGFVCRNDVGGDLTSGRCATEEECDTEFQNGTITTTSPPEPIPTTPTTPTTSTVIPPTNATTPATNGTTSTTSTPPTTTNATSTTSSPAPTNATSTLAPTPAPANGTTTAAPPHHDDGGDFRWGSFFGGIAFTAAMASIAYIVWRFYKARTERNYHTLTPNLM